MVQADLSEHGIDSTTFVVFSDLELNNQEFAWRQFARYTTSKIYTLADHSHT